MATETAISWTEHTWNPWRGCKMISPGCTNCYMFAQQLRYGRDPSTVIRTTTWRDPYRWQREAQERGTKELVFACSWSDWFHKDADDWRDDAWKVIQDCPNLVFQILTKRPERIEAHLPTDWGMGYKNVWLGVSVENNKYLWRVDELRRVPARVRFLSLEPLLGPLPDLDLRGVGWVIVGGESGPGWRPMDEAWALEILTKCRAAKVPFFFKQGAGRWPGRDDVLAGRERKQFPRM